MEGVDEQQIDVAAGVAIAARGGAENVPIYGFGVPGTERLSQALPQLKAQASQLDRDTGSDVVPVELVDGVAPHHLRPDDSLLDQAREAAPDTDFRAAWRLGGYFANGQGLPTLCQHSKYGAVERGGHRTGGVCQVHDLKV
jgi:hypothetical protein